MNYEIDMKNYRTIAGPAMLTPVAAGRLKIPTALTTGADAPEIKILLTRRPKQWSLKAESDDMESFARSGMGSRCLEGDAFTGMPQPIGAARKIHPSNCSSKS